MVPGPRGDFLSPPGVLVLTQIINPFRTIPFNMKDQFGLAYGGLRGAISFALAFTLPDNIGRRQLFITATIAIILFTVFLQVRDNIQFSILLTSFRIYCPFPGFSLKLSERASHR